MKGVTLFKDDSHITDVSVQNNGEIAIGSGGTGGEYYLRISAQERDMLLSALANEAPPGVTSDNELEFLQLEIACYDQQQKANGPAAADNLPDIDIHAFVVLRNDSAAFPHLHRNEYEHPFRHGRKITDRDVQNGAVEK